MASYVDAPHNIRGRGQHPTAPMHLHDSLVNGASNRNTPSGGVAAHQRYFIVSPNDSSTAAATAAMASSSSPTPPPRLTSPLSAHSYFLDCNGRDAAAAVPRTGGAVQRLTSPLRRAPFGIAVWDQKQQEEGPRQPMPHGGVRSTMARRLMAPNFLSTPNAKQQNPSSPTPHKYLTEHRGHTRNDAASSSPPPNVAAPPPPAFRLAEVEGKDNANRGRLASTPPDVSSTMADSEAPQGSVESPISNRQDDSRISAISSDFFYTSGSGHRYGPQTIIGSAVRHIVAKDTKDTEDSVRVHDHQPPQGISSRCPRRPPPPPPRSTTQPRRTSSTSPSRVSISPVVVSPATPSAALQPSPVVATAASPPSTHRSSDVPLEADELLFAAKVAEAYAYECYCRDPTYFLHPALAAAMEHRVRKDRAVIATNEVMHLGGLCSQFQWQLSCAKLMQIEQRIRRTLRAAEAAIFDKYRQAALEDVLRSSSSMLWGTSAREPSPARRGSGSAAWGASNDANRRSTSQPTERGPSRQSVDKTRNGVEQHHMLPLLSADLSDLSRQRQHALPIAVHDDDHHTAGYAPASVKPVDVVQYLMSLGAPSRADDDDAPGENAFLQRGKRTPMLLSSIVVPGTRRSATVDGPPGSRASSAGRRGGSAMRTSSPSVPTRTSQATTAALAEEMTVFHQVQIVPAGVRVVAPSQTSQGTGGAEVDAIGSPASPTAVRDAASAAAAPPPTAEAAKAQRSLLLQQAILSEVLSSSSASSAASSEVSSPTHASSGKQVRREGDADDSHSAEFLEMPRSSASSSSLASLCVEDVSTDAT